MKIKFSGVLEIDPADLPGLIVPTPPEATTPTPEAPTQPAKPEVSVPPVIELRPNFGDFFYGQLADPSVHHILIPSGKTHRIPNLKATPVHRKLVIESQSGTNLLIGIENYDHRSPRQDGHLMHIDSGSEILIRKVNLCSPPQLKLSQVWAPSIFSAAQNSNAHWTVAVQDCDTTALGKNPGFGLGFLYGGPRENHAALLNFSHCGPGLVDGKNSYPKSTLYLTFDNVRTDFANEADYGGSTILTRGKVSSGILHLTGAETAYALSNYVLDNPLNSNFSFIAHIGRYTFQIDGKSTFLSDKEIRLRPNISGKTYLKMHQGLAFFPGKEPHAGDSFTCNGQRFEIIQKNRTYVYTWTEWGNEPPNPHDDDLIHQLGCTLDKPLPDGIYEVEVSSSVTGIDADQPLYLVYKGNADYRSNTRTQFGNHEIIQGDVVGHLMYNHSNVSIWSRNFAARGYYRQTAKSSVTRPVSVNLVNTPAFEPEFQPGWMDEGVFRSFPITSDPALPMPARIRDLIKS